MECPGEADTRLENWDLADPEEIHLTLGAHDDASVTEDATGREEPPGCMKRLRSHWKLLLIIILSVFFSTMTSVICIVVMNQQRPTAKLHPLSEEIMTARNYVTQLKELLNSTFQNFTILENEYDKLNLLLNTTLYNITLLSAENIQLRKLLNSTLQAKTQLQKENKVLNMLINSTLEDCNLIKEENQQLNRVLNKSMLLITMATAEKKRLHSLLNDERQITAELRTKNQQQHSILSSDKLSFLWNLCDKDTLQCSSCMSGWTEHASRCFFLSRDTENWENARRFCLDNMGDLAEVTNAQDQAFLTNMTFQYVMKHPHEDFHSAWIGMQDLVKEGIFYWVSGHRVRWKDGLNFWKKNEPNNAVATWDKHEAGQDCVAIVPPKEVGTDDWLNSWDDIICGGSRQYLCETTALILP